MVCTSHGVSSVEEIDQVFARRIDSSTSGRDNLYVKLAGSLEHLISQSASASYVREPGGVRCRGERRSHGSSKRISRRL